MKNSVLINSFLNSKGLALYDANNNSKVCEKVSLFSFYY